MPRSLITLVTLATLVTPSIASATLTQPSQVFSALENMGKSVSYELVLHAHGEGTYVSIWASGSQEGEMTDPLSKAKLKATIDVAQGGVTMRTKVQMRMFDKTAYLKLDSVTGEESLLGALPIGSVVGQWIRMPLDDEIATDMSQMHQMVADPSIAESLSSFFQLQHHRFPGGNAYMLTASEALLEELGTSLGSMVNIRVTVNTDLGDNANFARLTIEATDPSMDAALDLVANIQTISGHVNVEVPKTSVLMEELGDIFAIPSLDDPFSIPEILTPEMEIPMSDDGWMEPLPMEDGWEADEGWNVPAEEREGPWVPLESPDAENICTAEPGTLAYLQQMRLGICTDLGPGRSSPIRRGEGKEWYHHAILR